LNFSFLGRAWFSKWNKKTKNHGVGGPSKNLEKNVLEQFEKNGGPPTGNGTSYGN
jgi:hypothetical protein